MLLNVLCFVAVFVFGQFEVDAISIQFDDACYRVESLKSH